MHMGNELKEQLTIASSQLSSFELMSDSKITIRGHTFNFYDLISPTLFDPKLHEQWAAQLHNAVPYPHLAIAELFDPDFLKLILEEF